MQKKEACIIFGGGGFIGSHLCESLLAKEYDVTLFDKQNFSKKNISQFVNDVKIVEGDFNNEIDIKNSLKGIDYVYHLVSSTIPATSNNNPIYDVETNLISSLRLFEECVKKKIKKVIFISSGGTVYGVPQKIPIKESYSSNPICSYGIIKKTIEEYLFMFERISGLNYNVFRLSNPFGERQNPFVLQGAITVFIKKAIDNETITIWGDGEIVRDYIYIKDATKILAESIIKNTEIKIFNVSSGRGYSLNQIIEIIKRVSGKDLKVEYRDPRIIDVPINILDNTFVKREFNWQPEISIEEGIRLTYNYLQNL